MLEKSFNVSHLIIDLTFPYGFVSLTNNVTVKKVFTNNLWARMFSQVLCLQHRCTAGQPTVQIFLVAWIEFCLMAHPGTPTSKLTHRTSSVESCMLGIRFIYVDKRVLIDINRYYAFNIMLTKNTEHHNGDLCIDALPTEKALFSLLTDS